MEECGGVHIHFPVEGSGSDTVVIRGPSSDVEKAKKQLLHLAEEKVSTADASFLVWKPSVLFFWGKSETALQALTKLWVVIKTVL